QKDAVRIDLELAAQVAKRIEGRIVLFGAVLVAAARGGPFRGGEEVAVASGFLAPAPQRILGRLVGLVEQGQHWSRPARTALPWQLHGALDRAATATGFGGGVGYT